MSKKFQPTQKQLKEQEKRREAFRRFVAQAATLTDTERESIAARIGIRNVEGHELSVHNQVLISFQLPTVSIVGGFNQWKQQGRSVRKGQHGAMIWVPGGKKNDAGEVTGEDLFFMTTTVFDISQTEESKA